MEYLHNVIRDLGFSSFCFTLLSMLVISFLMVMAGGRYYMNKIAFNLFYFFFYHVLLIISDSTFPINVEEDFLLGSHCLMNWVPHLCL